jgi:hypothetical protein
MDQIGALEQSGFLIVERLSGVSNRYTITLPKTNHIYGGVPTALTGCREGGANGVDGGVPTALTGGANGVDPNHHEPSKETSTSGELFLEVGKRTKAWRPSAIQLRLGALFKMRPTTPWNEAMLKSFKKHIPEDFNDEDLKQLEDYYRGLGKGPEQKDIRRRDLITLLNNFQGELDRARNWKEPALW